MFTAFYDTLWTLLYKEEECRQERNPLQTHTNKHRRKYNAIKKCCGAEKFRSFGSVVFSSFAESKANIEVKYEREEKKKL